MDMIDGLTRDNLHGIWLALTTPFKPDGRIDTDAVRENVRRCKAIGLHGVYTSDSDGEFYAIELDDFQTLIEAFGDECSRAGIASQAGVTWSSTRGITDRLRIAAIHGVLGAHVGHPTFMPMTDAAFLQFWHDVSDTVPEGFGLIEYNTPRQPHVLQGRDFRRLYEMFPKLVGVKYVQREVDTFIESRRAAPDLAFFSGETTLTAFGLHGARGNYSWMAAYNPRFMLDWWDDIEQGRWDEAAKKNKRVVEFSSIAKRHLKEGGNLHGIINKALAAASPFLVETTWETRKPYLPVSQAAWDRFKRVADEEFADLAFNW